MNSSSTRGHWRTRLRTRLSLMSLALGVAFGVVPLAVNTVDVSASSSGTSFSIVGCDGGASLVSTTAPYVCPDANYVRGNLVGWQELDLLPIRVTASTTGSAPATQTYTIAPVVAFMNTGVPGFDFMSLPTLNKKLSSPSCNAPTVVPATGAGSTFSPGLNNADVSLYRLWTITQAASTTCVYDYFVRLAIGSSGYPGSSLHADLATATLSGGVVTDLNSIPGVKTVQLDVEPTTAPSLGASIAASQGVGYIWTVSKGATPDPLGIANTCDPKARTGSVDVTVSWQRIPSTLGNITVVAQLFANNPSHRTLTVNATAQMRDASNAAVGAPFSTGSVAVPASSGNYLIGTFTNVFLAGSSTAYSVSVSGAYSDPVTGQPVGNQSLTASASAPVTPVANGANATATVTDTTTLSGTGLTYSVDSVSLSGGSFGSYVLGTPTTGSVTWTSPTLTGSGSAVLHETVIAGGAMISTGSLNDAATVNGSSGQSIGINLQIPLQNSALFQLTIVDTIPAILQGSETASFDFTVTDSKGNSTPATISFVAGQTSGNAILSGLAAGAYTVHQNPVAGWTAQPDQTYTAAVPTCASTVTFNSTVAPASASVQKITVPAGNESGWSFTLNGPGAPAGGETVSTTGAGALGFATALQEGAYTITESSTRSGWSQTASNGCAFTVDYPTDAGRIFPCTVTNTQAASSGTGGTTNNPPSPTPNPGGNTGGNSGNSGNSGNPSNPSNPTTPVTLPVTNGEHVPDGLSVSTPNTGADLPYTEAGLLVAMGGGLMAFGWRRRRPRRLILR